MAIEKQFSLFVQNKVGALSQLCVGLSEAGVNIRAISVIDDLEWGIVRVICDDADKTRQVLHDLGLMYGESQVLTAEIDNHPGALAELAAKLASKKINIEQSYATACGDRAIIVISTTDDKKANSLIGK